MTKRILFPTDFSQNSKNAEKYLLEFAKKYQAEVVLFHSYELPQAILTPPPGSTGRYQMHEEVEKEIINYSNENLTKMKEELEKEGLTVKVRMEKGDSGPTIVKIQEEEDCDLVIIGSRGLGSIKSFLLGSVSNYVVHQTKCPILLVH